MDGTKEFITSNNNNNNDSDNNNNNNNSNSINDIDNNNNNTLNEKSMEQERIAKSPKSNRYISFHLLVITAIL